MLIFNTSRLLTSSRLVECCLAILLAGVAFLLQCRELSDADVWCHLAAGDWVLEHHGVPRQDPFGFGPDSGSWVDIDWGFQVLLAAVHALGGLPAVILLAAGMSAAAVLLGLMARRPGSPLNIVVLCWLPALVLMTWRLGPRPETLSLLFIAGFLIILHRLDERPALAWLLAGLEVLWVNTASLFILGPVLFMLYLASLPASLLRSNRPAAPAADFARAWRHLGGAFVAVVAACLVNPYFFGVFRTAAHVLARLALPGDFFKEHVKPHFFEFLTLPDFARLPTSAATDWHLPAHFFLLLCLPLSFLLPAIWRARSFQIMDPQPAKDRTAKNQTGQAPTPIAAAVWLGGLVLVLTLFAGAALTLKEPPVYIWAIAGALFLLGGVTAVMLMGSSPAAAWLAFLGGITLSAGVVCLHAYLTGRGATTLAPTALVLTILPGLITLGLILRHGGSLFRILLILVFAYLGWQAIRNVSLFALVSGIVLSWNLGEWLVAMRDERRGARATRQERRGARDEKRHQEDASSKTESVTDPFSPLAPVLSSLVLAALLIFWGFSLTRDPLFGLSEEPGLAHAAARFAGQPGLPARAVVYDLRQAGLYSYHNGAEHRTLMDSRLTLDRRRNFTAYLDINAWLNKNDRRWQMGLEELGNPLLVISHRGNESAEAAVLSAPTWRIVYYDALAAIFVPAGDTERERTFPTVDFAARRWHTRAAPPTEVRPLAEMSDLHGLAVAVKDVPESTWKWRVPLLLTALDRAPAALDQHAAAAWTLMGTCHWDMTTNLRATPPRPRDDWDPARGLSWAQATYCFRRALLLDKGDRVALQALAASFDVRSMDDAKQTFVRKLAGQPPEVRENQPDFSHISPDDLFAALSELLKRSYPEACVDLFEKARAQSFQVSWKLAERVAPVYMNLGRPADARRLWQEASGGSESLRLCRIAETYWVERDFDKALGLYHQAGAQNPKLGDVRWGLAMLLTQLGRADAALEACREGLTLYLTAPQQADLIGLQAMLRRAAATR